MVPRGATSVNPSFLIAALVTGITISVSCATYDEVPEDRTSGGEAARKFLGSATNEIRIGLVAPLRNVGDTLLGAGIRNGVALAQSHSQPTDATMRVRLLVRNQEAVWGSVGNTIADLVQRDAVCALLLAVDAPYVHVAGNLAERFNVPIVFLGSASPGPTDTFSRWLFTGSPSDEAQCRELLKVALDLGLKRVAVVREIDRHGRYGVEAFMSGMRANRTPVIADLLYAPFQTVFTLQLDQLERFLPDGIVLWGSRRPLGTLLLQLRGRGIAVPVFASDRLLDPEQLQRLGPAANNVYVAAPFDPMASRDVPPEWTEFREAYANRFGRLPDLYSGYAYFAFRELAETALQVGPDPIRIQERLVYLRKSKAPDPVGRGLYAPLNVYRLENGRLVPTQGIVGQP